ncbi:MAG: uroporphyrinogen-III synthase [Candidatus Marinimicrobia bacterium]|nr:uroporphyrinogen-III synthase [Candidatus Neomarinimicrobiota bacterium]
MTWNIYFTGTKVPELNLFSHLEINIYHTPTIQINYTEPESFQTVEGFLNKGAPIIFLSRNGVIGFQKWLKRLDKSFEHWSNPLIAVGSETSLEIERVFHRSSHVPENQRAKGIPEILKTYPHKQAILITGDRSRPELPRWMTENGWDFITAVVYQTDWFENLDLKQNFKNGDDEILIFSSPSTVVGFLQTIDQNDLKSIQSKLISIGPTTSWEIEKLSGRVFLEAANPSVNSVISETINLITHVQ